jgi:serine/threonine protein kinase/Tfp pilus assembly protein PilF
MTEESLFHDALAKPAGERAAFLDAACAKEPQLRAAVEALLAAHDASTDRLGRPQAELRPNLGPEPARPAVTTDYQRPSEPGAVVGGRYTLVERIGEGGMGEVWVSKQTEPVKRKVAVKLIKAGMDSKAVLQRFDQERQALALMDHPNIARVLDGGMTPTGQPFFVMDLVNGLPLTKFCDQMKLPVRERLELFTPICQAVQHAHQKGIVHRDLKPSNILVTIIDGKPVPKVIDFGVAKATSGKLTDETMSTGFGAVVGTLEYMAPEQAGYAGADIDTRADIYSLGVILYELLTGLRPIDGKRLRKVALSEMVRILEEEVPSKPSTRLSTDESLPSSAALRQTEPKRLMAMLRGELDWVVMKCLEKQRDRRYETANGLAREVQRYLADEPVEARPPSAGYRFRKFVRRHKGQVLAAVLVLSALLAGITGTTFGLFRAEAARRDEAQQRAAAEKAAESERLAKLDADTKRQQAEANLEFAKKGNEILGSVFAGLDPKANYATVADLRSALRDNLNKAVDELEGSAIGEPLEVAAMQDTLGTSLIGLGEASLAVEVLNKALATRKAELGPDHPVTYISMNNLAMAYLESGEFTTALPLLEETLQKSKAQLGPDHRETLCTMNNLAMAYQASDQVATAVALLEETLQKTKANLGPDHPNTLNGMNNLANAYALNGQFAEAVPLYEETLEKMKDNLGPDHPNTLRCMSNLATAYSRNGQFAKAVPLYEETLEKMKDTVGPDHPDTLSTLNKLAFAFEAIGQLTKFAALLEESLQKHKAKLGPDHSDTLSTMNNLAYSYLASGQLARAVPLFEETLEKRKAKLGPNDPETRKSMGNLAKAYMDNGQADKAAALLESLLQKHQAEFGAEHPETLGYITVLGLALLEQKKWSDAEPVLRDCLASRQKQIPDSWQTFHTQLQLGVALLGQKRYDEAEPLLLNGFEGMKEREKDIPPQAKAGLAEAAWRLVQLYETLGKKDEAGKWRIQLEREGGKEVADEDDDEAAKRKLAIEYMNAGKKDQALPLLVEISNSKKARLGPDHLDTIESTNLLGVVYWQLGQLDQSVPLFEQILRVRDAKLGRDHPDTIQARANLGVNYKDAGKLRQAIGLLEEAREAARKDPQFAWVVNALLDAYARAGENAKLANLLQEELPAARKALPADSPQLAGQLAQLGMALLQSGAYDDADALIRECLAIRETKESDAWTTFNTQSMLGGVLLGQKKYAEAEPLLLNGYEGMQQREKTIPPEGKIRLVEALERLVQLYEATERADESAKWRKELEGFNAPREPTEEP